MLRFWGRWRQRSRQGDRVVWIVGVHYQRDHDMYAIAQRDFSHWYYSFSPLCSYLFNGTLLFFLFVRATNQYPSTDGFAQSCVCCCFCVASVLPLDQPWLALMCILFFCGGVATFVSHTVAAIILMPVISRIGVSLAIPEMVVVGSAFAS